MNHHHDRVSNYQDRISVRDFEIINKPARSGRGTLLAKFTTSIGGITLLGCVLVEAADGYQAVLPPGGVGSDGRRSVFFADPDLRDRVIRLAQLKMLDEPGEAEDAGLRRVLGSGEREALERAGI